VGSPNGRARNKTAGLVAGSSRAWQPRRSRQRSDDLADSVVVDVTCGMRRPLTACGRNGRIHDAPARHRKRLVRDGPRPSPLWVDNAQDGGALGPNRFGPAPMTIAAGCRKTSRLHASTMGRNADHRGPQERTVDHRMSSPMIRRSAPVVGKVVSAIRPHRGPLGPRC
jgi:hypothetical protein